MQAFHHDPDMLDALVRDGAITSITAGSLVGQFGETVAASRCSWRTELIHKWCPTPTTTSIAPGREPQLEHAGLGPLREWLTEQVPAAILAGEDTLPRPLPTRDRDARLPGAARRTWWRRASGLTRAS